jgi:hypothetical protein
VVQLVEAIAVGAGGGHDLADALPRQVPVAIGDERLTVESDSDDAAWADAILVEHHRSAAGQSVGGAASGHCQVGLAGRKSVEQLANVDRLGTAKQDDDAGVGAGKLLCECVTNGVVWFRRQRGIDRWQRLFEQRLRQAGVGKERHRHCRAAKRDLTVEDLAAGGGADETGRRPALAECRGDLGAVRGVEDAGEDLDQDRSGCLLGGE